MPLLRMSGTIPSQFLHAFFHSLCTNNFTLFTWYLYIYVRVQSGLRKIRILRWNAISMSRRSCRCTQDSASCEHLQDLINFEMDSHPPDCLLTYCEQDLIDSTQLSKLKPEREWCSLLSRKWHLTLKMITTWTVLRSGSFVSVHGFGRVRRWPKNHMTWLVKVKHVTFIYRSKS